jgi:hypothetical protein
MNRPRLAFFLLILAIASSSGLSAQGTSAEGAVFLVLPVGAQGVSLGRAVTAMPGQESAFWNPAGLVATTGSRVLLLRGETVVGASTGISTLLSRPGVGTLGVSYLLWDMGGSKAGTAITTSWGPSPFGITSRWCQRPLGSLEVSMLE